VVAHVVIADGDGPSAEELRAFCRERLAPHKVPKDFVFVDQLPRNEQGKLLRDRLQ
jgi:acyl-coenzyme A synthetase/AMP-(fatty) acid ligase